MEQEILYVLQAVSEVDEHYHMVMGLTRDKIYQQAAENAYTAELYYILKTIIPEEFKNLVWHFDLNKERAKSIRPDLVLHKSTSSRDDQRIYIEVKTASTTNDDNISKDIEKLLNAVSPNNDCEKLGFKFGIYIVGNISLERIVNVVKLDSTLSIDLLSKIYLIHFNSPSYIESITIRKFSNL